MSGIKQLTVKSRDAVRAPSPTREQLAVLGVIAKYPKGTRITVKLVASDLGLSHNTAQLRLARMEKAGLVKRGGWEIA